MRELLTFDETQLSDTALSYLLQIKKVESAVSIHIRRGDYLNDKNSLIFYDLCSSDYYHKAIQRLNSLDQRTHTFFVFSDDTEWVKSNFHLNNAIVVESGMTDSPWQDLFLMSQSNASTISFPTVLLPGGELG